MREYKLHSISQHIESFLDDLTNTYIRLNRARFWSDGVSEDKNQAFSCLDEVLKQFSIMMAPFTPFLSEKIFQLRNQNILNNQNVDTSVHGENYPTTTNHNDFCNSLDVGVHNMQQILILGRQARNNAKIKTKIPLKNITIAHGKKAVLDSIKSVESYILKELNVKKVIFTTDENAFILLKAKLNLPKLGKKLGKKIREARTEVENLSHKQIQKYEETNHYESDIGVFTGDDIIIERKTREGSQALSNRHITIELNTDLDEALIGEGIAREMVNRIQKLRKEKDLQVSDRIEIKLHCDENLKKIIETHRKYIETETLCLHMKFSENKQHYSIAIEEYVASIMITTAQKKD